MSRKNNPKTVLQFSGIVSTGVDQEPLASLNVIDWKTNSPTGLPPVITDASNLDLALECVALSIKAKRDPNPAYTNYLIGQMEMAMRVLVKIEQTRISRLIEALGLKKAGNQITVPAWALIKLSPSIARESLSHYWKRVIHTFQSLSS
jgi:hypothetical protein